MEVIARSTQQPGPATLEVFDQADDSPAPAKKDTLSKAPALGNLLAGKLSSIPLPAGPVGTLRLFFPDNQLEDLWIALTWGNEA